MMRYVFQFLGVLKPGELLKVGCLQRYLEAILLQPVQPVTQ